MGLSLFPRNRRPKDCPADRPALRERFGAHYPRLFAYARSCVRDDPTAGKIVVEAFSRAFARCSDLPDDKFQHVLFGLARRLCSGLASRHPRREDLLSPREREILSLIFDAQLHRSEIGSLLKIREQAVTSALVRGLRKLRANAGWAGLTPYLGST